MLSPRLQLRVAQKQILTPGLVQMVSLLQLNRLELKEMINQEIINNPVLEESQEGGEEISPEELQPLLEAERASDPADKEMLEAADIQLEASAPELNITETALADAAYGDTPSSDPSTPAPEASDAPEAPSSTDPFDEIDFGSFFDDYLDPGYRSPSSESVEKPGFETFLSQPQTLPDYLRSQLAVMLI